MCRLLLDFVALKSLLVGLYALIDYARREITDFITELIIAEVTLAIELFIDLLGYKFGVQDAINSTICQNKIIS